MFLGLIAVMMLVRFVKVAVIIVKFSHVSGSRDGLRRRFSDQVLVVQYTGLKTFHLTVFGVIDYDNSRGFRSWGMGHELCFSLGFK
jgi:hypothetical protein